MRTAISEGSPLEKTPPLNTNLFKVFGSPAERTGILQD
jgi:hypothetical protein